MEDLIRINKRLVPLEQIALVEPYTPDDERPLQSTREFHSRVVMTDRTSVLSELSVAHFIETHNFRLIAADGLLTNPAGIYWVETFEPDENFKPEKAYASRLLWRDPTGLARSKLLLAAPEIVLAVAVRGVPAAEAMSEVSEAVEGRGTRPRRRRVTRPRRPAALATDPA